MLKCNYIDKYARTIYMIKVINNLIFFLSLSYCYNQPYQKLTLFNTYLISLFHGAMVMEALQNLEDGIFHLSLSVQFSHSVVSDSLRPHEPQHTRPPCPSSTPGVHPNSCPLSRWCHPTISSSINPFSSCPQPFPASGSFQMSQLFASGGQNIGVSASTSVLPMNTRDWSPLG